MMEERPQMFEQSDLQQTVVRDFPIGQANATDNVSQPDGGSTHSHGLEGRDAWRPNTTAEIFEDDEDDFDPEHATAAARAQMLAAVALEARARASAAQLQAVKKAAAAVAASQRAADAVARATYVGNMCRQLPCTSHGWAPSSGWPSGGVAGMVMEQELLRQDALSLPQSFAPQPAAAAFATPSAGIPAGFMGLLEGMDEGMHGGGALGNGYEEMGFQFPLPAAHGNRLAKAKTRRKPAPGWPSTSITISIPSVKVLSQRGGDSELTGDPGFTSQASPPEFTGDPEFTSQPEATQAEA